MGGSQAPLLRAGAAPWKARSNLGRQVTRLTALRSPWRQARVRHLAGSLVGHLHRYLRNAPRAVHEVLKVVAQEIAVRGEKFVRRAAICQRIDVLKVLPHPLARELDPFTGDVLYASGEYGSRLHHRLQ